jgi:hypothetical protein
MTIQVSISLNWVSNHIIADERLPFIGQSSFFMVNAWVHSMLFWPPPIFLIRWMCAIIAMANFLMPFFIASSL